ncbi:hypothetical protein AHF37_03169 [Paragonimus kellicotti]|nr:hypothetical protein AHF37_03169 [Paragonimus kellicotti]
MKFKMSDVLSRLEAIIDALFRAIFQETNENHENYNIQYIVRNPERCGTQMTFIISKIHQAMLDECCITKRSIYYGNPEILKNQGVVDRILARLCTWLEVPRWILGVVNNNFQEDQYQQKATGKLKLFGDLTWTTENGKVTCSAKDEVNIECFITAKVNHNRFAQIKAHNKVLSWIELGMRYNMKKG